MPRYHGNKVMRGGEVSGKGAMRMGSGMINDDFSQPCLLPKEVMDKVWPSSGGYLGGHQPDLFDGVNDKLNEDRQGMNKVFHPGKY